MNKKINFCLIHFSREILINSSNNYKTILKKIILFFISNISFVVLLYFISRES